LPLKNYLFLDMVRFAWTSLTILLSWGAFAQIGGTALGSSLRVTMAPRMAGMGGNLYADPSGDVNVALINPAGLDSNLHGRAALNVVNYMADMDFVQGVYAHQIKPRITLAAGFSHFGFGDFTEADENGNITGAFSASDDIFHVSAGYQPFENWVFGSQIKVLLSQYAAFASTALVTDWAVRYHHPEKRFSATLVARNLGWQVSRFHTAREKTPGQLDFAMSGRLEHMPLRWHFTWEHLQRFDLTFIDPNDPTVDPLTGDPIDNSISFAGKALRHVVAGVELFTEKKFNLRLGYNFRRQAELGLDDIRTSAGLNFGFGMRIKGIQFDYARSVYHFSGASNQFGLSYHFINQ
jgi:hypothetical protein